MVPQFVAASSVVVPAKAGTHTPQRSVVATQVIDLNGSGYGSPPSRGRQQHKLCK